MTQTQETKTKLRKRRGRPPSPPGVSRHNRVVTFLNDAEYKALTQLAEDNNEALSMALYRLLADQLKSTH